MSWGDLTGCCGIWAVVTASVVVVVVVRELESARLRNDMGHQLPCTVYCTAAWRRALLMLSCQLFQAQARSSCTLTLPCSSPLTISGWPWGA